MKNVPETYYFSLTGKTTYTNGSISYPYPATSESLKGYSLLAGAYTNTTLLGNSSLLWRPNDGLVPIVSTFSESLNRYVNYTLYLTLPSEHVATFGAALNLPKPGMFHFTGVMDHVDHYSIISDESNIEQIYLNIAGLLWSLPQ